MPVPLTATKPRSIKLILHHPFTFAMPDDRPAGTGRGLGSDFLVTWFPGSQAEMTTVVFCF